MSEKYFRTFVLLTICLFFSSFFASAQEGIKIEMLESSPLPISEKVHWYKFQIENSGAFLSETTIGFENINCENVSLDQVSLEYELLDENKKTTSETIKLKPNEKKVYYLKTMRTPQTKLQTYSCVRVFTKSNNSKILNSSFIIRQLIPDPSLEN